MVVLNQPNYDEEYKFHFGFVLGVNQSFATIRPIADLRNHNFDSTFLPDISAMIITTAYVFFSILISAISVFVDMLPKSLKIASLVHVIAYFFPNFFYFFNSCKFSGIVLISLIAYSFSMTAIFLLIASFQMNRRDMI